MNTLEFKRRGDVMRLSHPDYDGIFDDIDLEFDVQMAIAGHEYEAEISRNGDMWRAVVYYRTHTRSMMTDLLTQEDAKAWCAEALPLLKREVDLALALTAEFKPGMYMMQIPYDSSWVVVTITHEYGFANVWYFGWEAPDKIEEVAHHTLTRFTLAAPDGSIIRG